MTFEQDYIIKTFCPGVFPCHFFVVVAKDDYYGTPAFATRMGREFTYMDGAPLDVSNSCQFAAFTCQQPLDMEVSRQRGKDGRWEITTNRGIAMFFPESGTGLGAIIHECVHAVMCMCGHLGLDVDDQELMAYMVQFTTRETWYFINGDKNYKTRYAR